jgi:Arc/MetJ-type ribon-helix-helix transcriptional regulator
MARAKSEVKGDRQITFRSPDDLIELIDRLAAKRGYDRSQVIRYALQLIAELGEIEPEIVRPYSDRMEARNSVRDFCAKHSNDKARKG